MVESQRVTRARLNQTLNATLSARSPVKKCVKPDWNLHRDKLAAIDNPLKAINFVLNNFGIPHKS